MVTRAKRSTTARSATVDERGGLIERAKTGGKTNLLRAGLKALSSVRDDVVQRQSRVFEAVLGVDPVQGLSGLIRGEAGVSKTAREVLGIQKFEQVFDQRVADALERMGMPSVGEVKALTKEVAALRRELRASKAQPSRRAREKVPRR